MINPKKKKIGKSDGISNLGRKTLQDLSDMKKINLENAISALSKEGLQDVDANSRIKHLADELEGTPLELYNDVIR